MFVVLCFISEWIPGPNMIRPGILPKTKAVIGLANAALISSSKYINNA